MVTNHPRSKSAPSRVRAQPMSYQTAESPGLSREIAAGEFKARCLALMDELPERGGEYVITKRGVPVARLIPARVERRRLLGSMKGTLKTRGDIVGPLDEPW